MGPTIEDTTTRQNRYNETHPHGRPKTPGATVPRPVAELEAMLDRDQEPTHVGAVLAMNANGQVLVGFNRKRQVWDVPQGVLEEGEAPEATALRELREETGLDLEEGDILRVAEFTSMTDEFARPWETSLFIVREGVDVSGAANAEPEKCDKLAWMAPCQIPFPRGLSLRTALTLLGRG